LLVKNKNRQRRNLSAVNMHGIGMRHYGMTMLALQGRESYLPAQIYSGWDLKKYTLT
jgi:hypothetical protein